MFNKRSIQFFEARKHKRKKIKEGICKQCKQKIYTREGVNYDRKIDEKGNFSYVKHEHQHKKLHKVFGSAQAEKLVSKIKNNNVVAN